MGASTPEEVREVFEKLSEKEWDELNRRLIRFYNRYYRRERRLERDDLINKAILDVLSGGRKWPDGVKLVTLLCGAMRSNASHILKGMNDRPTRPFEETDMECLKKEDFGAYLQLCDELRSRVPPADRLLTKMVALLIKDPKLKRGDFRALLRDVPKKDVHNAQRRLNRLIDKLHEELGHDEERWMGNQAKGTLRAGEAVHDSRRGVRGHGKHDDGRDRRRAP